MDPTHANPSDLPEQKRSQEELKAPELLVRHRSNQPEAKKSALHTALRINHNTTTSHSEMLPAHRDDTVVMVKYTVYWVNKQDDKAIQLLIEWPHVEIVIEAIRDVIPYINQRLAEENSPYILNSDPNMYEFFKAKKSGKPKLDYPGLDMNQVLSMTGVVRLTLVEKPQSDAVQLRRDKFMEDDMDYKGNEVMVDNKGTMLKSTMPGMQSVASQMFDEQGEQYVEETFCCCFKRMRKIRQSELREKLIEN